MPFLRKKKHIYGWIKTDSILQMTERTERHSKISRELGESTTRSVAGRNQFF